MLVRRISKYWGVAALCLALPTAAALAQNDEPVPGERAILVLDASGSMWGQIDDVPKITIARDVIGGLLESWDPNVELGVTAYGHREKGNCGDIETLVEVGPADQGRITSAIESLNPKGKTPLTDAVRQAALSLRYTEERATVILVSDGKETCNVDPCAAAADLEATGVDFTVHVVGFDLEAEEKAQLQCLAETTGGRFLSAANASELHDAMETTVELVAAPEPEPKPKRTIKVESLGEVNVVNATEKLYARLPDQTGSFVAQFKNDQPVQLQAGSYRLDSQRQERLLEFDVKPGETLTIDLNDLVGWASVKNATEKLYARLPDQTGSFVAQLKNDQPAQLQAGSYRLDSNRQKDLLEFDVKPGETLNIDMNDLVGWASMTNATEKLYVRLPDQTGSFIALLKNDQPVQLQPGSYRLDSDKQKGLLEFDVKPGETLTIDANKLVGWASVTNATEQLYARLPDQKKGGVSALLKNDQPAQLQAGSYRLDSDRQKGLLEFDVKPGETLNIDMNDLVGWASMTNATEQLYVRLPDQTSSYVTQLRNDRPAQLQPGTYRLGSNNQKDLLEFDVKPGETLTIDMHDLVGWASVTNATEQLYVRLPGQTTGGFVAQLRGDQTAQLQPGTYRLDSPRQKGLLEFDVKLGETLTIDVNDLVGWASVTNATEQLYVRLPDQTTGGFIASLRNDRPVQLQAGTYRLDGQRQKGLLEFDVQPGEEVVLDLGG